MQDIKENKKCRRKSIYARRHKFTNLLKKFEIIKIESDVNKFKLHDYRY